MGSDTTGGRRTAGEGGLDAGKRAAWIREARIDIMCIIGIIRKGLGVPAANARPGGARFAG